MATSGIVRGQLVKFQVATVTVDDQTESSLSLTTGVSEVTTKQSSGKFKEFLSDYTEGTGTVSGYYSADATEGVSQAFSDLTTGDAIAILFTTEATGDNTYGGSAILTQVDISHPLEGPSSYSFSYQLTGTITEGTA